MGLTFSAGFDIQSFTVESEEELFIEVKTTNCGKYQPFYITDNELAYSLQWNQQYCLYRVYDFKNEARLFRLQGAVEQYVHLQAKNYKASFN
ncbi:protein NO VEIN domain-containing protein [Ketobacter sp.]